MNLLLLTAGRGPVECELHLVALADAVERLCAARGVSVERAAATSASVAFQTAHGPADFAGLLGTHCVVARSARRARRSRKRWFLGVSLHPVPPDAPAPRDEDLVFDVTTARGPGGQHVNRSATAVRLLHRPSGIVVHAQEARSQHANCARARARLQVALATRELCARAAAATARWRAHDALVRGAPVITWRYDRRGALVR